MRIDREPALCLSLFIIGLLVFCLLVPSGVMGKDEKPEVSDCPERKSSLVLDGYTYQYERRVQTPFVGWTSESGCIGLITVTENKSGSVVYRSESNYTPVVFYEGGMSAISVVTASTKHSPFSKEYRSKQSLVIFCGSLGGPNEAIQIFMPGIGVVGMINFDRAPANITATPDGNFVSIVSHEVVFHSHSLWELLGPKVYYRVVHRIKCDSSLFCSVSSQVDDVAKRYYAKNMAEDYDIFAHDKKKNISSAITAFLSAAVIGDKKNMRKIYDEIDGTTNGKADSIVEELKKEFTIDFNMERDNGTTH